MGECPHNPLAVSLFGMVMAINPLLFIALQTYILRRLIKPEFADAQDPYINRKSFVGVLSYLLGAAWLSVQAAFVIYMLTLLFFITLPRPRHVARRDSASGAPHEAHQQSRM